MKGTFIIHLRADEKCIWVQWKGEKKAAQGRQRQIGRLAGDGVKMKGLTQMICRRRKKKHTSQAFNDSPPCSIYSAHTASDKDCLLESFSLIRPYRRNIFNFYPR